MIEKPKLTGVGSSGDLLWITIRVDGEDRIVELTEIDKVLLRKHVEER